MKHCWFLCKSFKWNKVAPFYDGDLNLYKRIFFTIYSFLRKFQIYQDNKSKKLKMEKFTPLNTFDGLLVEPMNPSMLVTKKYLLDKKTRFEISGKLSSHKMLHPSELKELKNFL